MKLPADIPTRRAFRGLVVHSARYRRTTGRAVVGSLWYVRGAGTCLWCGLPAPSPRHRWHAECARYYRLASGHVTTAGSQLPLIAPGPCVECGADGTEIDHRTALSVARERGRRSLLRAVLPGNLRWLCESCHRVKTAADRRVLADLRRRRKQPELFGWQ